MGIDDDREKQLIREGRKIAALSERIQQTAYMTSPEVRKHLRLSRSTLEGIPPEVLPFVPGNGKERVFRRYHPADVAAYPARARRWRKALEEDIESLVLAEMRRELEEVDRVAVQFAINAARVWWSSTEG